MVKPLAIQTLTGIKQSSDDDVGSAIMPLVLDTLLKKPHVPTKERVAFLAFE